MQGRVCPGVSDVSALCPSEELPLQVTLEKWVGCFSLLCIETIWLLEDGDVEVCILVKVGR